MCPDVEAATQRVVAMRASLADGAGDIGVGEIEDELCAGYAHALEGDAWLTQAEARLHDLIDDTSSPAHGHELRALAATRSAMRGEVDALRRELALLHCEHDRLRAGARPA